MADNFTLRKQWWPSAAIFVLALFLAPVIYAQPIATWNGEWPPSGGAYNDSAGGDRNVPVTAIVDEPSHTITLNFYRPGTYDIYRKLRSSTNWGAKLATTSASTFADTNVVVGTAYEYQLRLTSYDISANTSSGNFTQPYGYIIAGINVDTTGSRGRAILVVTDNIRTNLPAELDTFKHDLAADGWLVETINVPAAPNYNGSNSYSGTITVAPASGTVYNGLTSYSETTNLHKRVRSIIQQFNTDNSGTIKNVILLGKVPAPRSGAGNDFKVRIDGHSFQGAETADAYYADMDGTWTDTNATHSMLTNGSPPTIAAGSDRYNVPGDGKFDAYNTSDLGGNQQIEFGLGRIDFSLCGGGEIPATRVYLNKLHRFKTCAADFRPARKAVIREGFDSVNESGWMAYPALVEPGNIVAIDNSGGAGGNQLPYANSRLPQDPTGRLDLDGLYTITNGPFLFYNKGNDSIFNMDSGSKAVFWNGYQSLWGWWAENSGIANRCAAEDTMTLSFTWTGWSVRFYYHTLAFDGCMGDVWKACLNNTSFSDATAYLSDTIDGVPGVYPYGTGSTGNGNYNGQLWNSLFGDPTLRCFMVIPPSNLAATPAPSGNNVTLNWTNSTDTNLLGVIVERSATPYGPWTRLTPSPIVASTFTDTTAAAGEWTYSVRAVKLETTGNGTFLNPSLGATITIRTASAASALAITTTTLPAAAWQTTNGVTLTATNGNQPYIWSLVGGSLPNGMTFSADGRLSGAPTRNGTYQPVFRVTDYRGATAQAAFTLNVAAYRTVTIPAEADAMTLPGLPTFNYGIARSLAINSPNKAFLRFPLPALTNSDRLIAARLRLTSDSTGLPLNSITVSVNLLADANDNWVEGTKAGDTTTSTSELTWTNLPNPGVNAAVAPASISGTIPASARLTFDIFAHCTSTLAADAAHKLGLLVNTDQATFPKWAFVTRENSSDIAPVVELDITHAPVITLTRPATGSASLAAGQGLVLTASVTGASNTVSTWTQTTGAGNTAFANTNSPSTTATFNADGNYSLLLTADDGELVVTQPITVAVNQPVPAPYVTALTASEVLHYKFNASSGTNAADASPSAVTHTGTLKSGNAAALPTWSPSGGKFGGALNFNNANMNYIETPDEATLDNTTKLTLACWINPTSTALDSNKRGLIVKRTSFYTANSYSLAVFGSKVYFVAANGTIELTTANNVLTASTWTHITAVFDGTQAVATDRVKIYINGASVPLTATSSTGTSISDNASPLDIGFYSTSPAVVGNFFSGLIDEVRVYRGRALTASDIADLQLTPEATVGPTGLGITTPGGSLNTGTPFSLTGTVTNNGLMPSNGLTLSWSRPVGAGNIAFTPASAVTTSNATTSATADAGGAHTIRLIADDGSTAVFVDASVTVQGSAYQTWAAGITWPPGANTTPTGDADGDGLLNIGEFALGTSPTGGSSTNDPTAGLDGQHRLALTFSRDPALTDFTYEVEATSNFGTPWTVIARSTGGSVTTDVGGNTYSVSEKVTGSRRQVTVTDPTSSTRRFLRLKITPPTSP